MYYTFENSALKGIFFQCFFFLYLVFISDINLESNIYTHQFKLTLQTGANKELL